MAEKKNEAATLKEVVAVRYITAENAKFEKESDFVKMTVRLPNEDGVEEEKVYNRIFLHRAFPFDYPYAYISVLDINSKEIGIIREIDELGEEASKLLREELDRKYFTPVIRQILSVKDKFGYSYWKVLTDEGEMEFTMRDTFSNLLKVGGTRIFANDIDGNRYEIPDIEKLDRKSFKRIELFL
ncbi:MAG: DUF1854 domain-containing protein [Clostridia bacterium]|nr:DUF1854 domain-containing protein [Clostridia bacterium]